ncbi:phospholipid-transporting ATPase ABCA3-like isoform X2 [Amblyomma americanum]
MSKVMALVWRNVWIRRLRRQMPATVLELALAGFAFYHLPPSSKAGAAKMGSYHERELPPPQQLAAYDLPDQLVLDAAPKVVAMFVENFKVKGRISSERHRKIRLFVNGQEVDEPPNDLPTIRKDDMMKVEITGVNSERALLQKCADPQFSGVCARVSVDLADVDKSVNYSCYIDGHLAPAVLRTRRSGYALQQSPTTKIISSCQNLIEANFLAATTKNVPVVQVVSQQFPIPHYPAPPSMDNVMASLCFMVAYMMPFSRSVWTIVEENSSGMATMLRSMGASAWMYWMAHFFSVFVHVSVYSVVAYVMMAYSTYQAPLDGASFEDFQHSLDYAPYLNAAMCHTAVLLFLFTLFGIQTALHAMLLSCITTRPHIATALAAFYWASMFFMSKPWATLEDYLFDDRYPKYLAAVFPVNMLYLTFFHIRWTIYYGYRADWSMLRRQAFYIDNVTLISAWRASILSCVILFAVIWYLVHVLPTVCEHPLTLGFPFSRAFWRRKRPDVVEVFSPEQQHSDQEELPGGVNVVIQATNLTKEYAKLKAVTKVNFKALDNQITVILATDGSGKTTLLRLLSGDLPPTSGRVTVCGFDTMLSSAEVRYMVCFCPRLATFAADMTVWEHVLLYAAIKGVPLKYIKLRAMEVLRETEFNENLSSYPHLLAAGAKQRLHLAIALLGKPKVLCLDEPTGTLDEEARREVWTLLERLRANCAIVMTSSLTEEADLLGDRVAILCHGRISCCGTPTSLKQAHGTGYEIRFPNTDKVLAVEEQLLSIVRERTAQARVSRTRRNLIFSLGTQDTRGFTDMFSRLEDLCKENDIEDMGVTFTTLEDVFIKMSTEPEIVESKISSHAEVSVVQASSDHIKVSPSLGGQITALLAKRRAQLAANWVPALVLYLLFVATVFLMEYVQSGPTWMVFLFPEAVTALRQKTGSLDRSIEIDLGSVYPDSVTFVRGLSTPLATKHYAPLIQDATTIRETDVPLINELDTLSSEAFLSFSRQYAIGADFGDPESPQTWWNPYVPYSKSISTSLMNSALLRYYTGDAKARFRVHLLAYTKRNASSKETQEYNSRTVLRDNSDFLERGLRGLSPWRKFLLPPLMGLSGAAFVWEPVAEAAAGAKRLQLMTGVSGLVYWLSHYLFDAVHHVLLWAIAGAAFAVNNSVREDTAVAFLALVLASYPTLTGMSYLSSFIAKSVGTWFIVLFVAHTALTSQAVTLSTSYVVLHWLFTLLPPFAFSSGVVKLLLLDAENQLCDEYASTEAADGSSTMDLLLLACDTTRSERLQLDPAVIDVCCKNRESSLPPFTLSPFAIHELAVGVNLIVLLIEGLAMFAAVVFFDSARLICMRNSMAERQLRALYEQLDTDVANEAREAPRLATAPGHEGRALVVCDIWRLLAGTRMPQLKAVNFSLLEGECFGLLGTHGSGKTLLLEVLSALALRSSGNAYSQKYTLSESPRKWQSQIGYCPEKGGLVPSLTVAEHLLLFARLRGVPRSSEQSYIDKLLKSCNLFEKKNDYPAHFGISEKRKLSLAVALVGAPSLLFLDEPLQGVDTGTRQRVVEILKDIRDKSRAAIIYASVSMQQLELMCDRLAILVDGQVQCMGTIEHLREKFGEGMMMKIQLDETEKQRGLEVQSVMRALFPECRVIYYHQSTLSTGICQNHNRYRPAQGHGTVTGRRDMLHAI